MARRTMCGHSLATQLTFVALFWGLSLTSCQHGVLNSQTRALAEDDIREAVFCYQFEHNASAIQQKADYYFLALGDGQDPSPELMARFKGHSPPVLPGSLAINSPDGVTHKSLGGKGLFFNVDDIHWTSENAAKVTGGYFEAGLSASGNTYRVKRRNGEWVVTKDTMNWIA